MKGQPAISPVYRLAPAAPPCPLAAWGRIEALRRRAWRQHGLLPVSELPEDLARQVEKAMEARYGRRA